MNMDREKIYKDEYGELEMGEYYRHIQCMRESCTVYDGEICGLLDEQQELLTGMKMEKNEFLDNLKGLHVWEAAVLRKKL